MTKVLHTSDGVVRCAQNFRQRQVAQEYLSNRRRVVPGAAAVALGNHCVTHFAAFMHPRQQPRCQASVSSNSNGELVWRWKEQQQREAHSPTILLLIPGNKKRKKSRDGERNVEEGSDHLPLTS